MSCSVLLFAVLFSFFRSFFTSISLFISFIFLTAFSSLPRVLAAESRGPGGGYAKPKILCCAPILRLSSSWPPTVALEASPTRRGPDDRSAGWRERSFLYRPALRVYTLITISPFGSYRYQGPPGGVNWGSQRGEDTKGFWTLGFSRVSVIFRLHEGVFLGVFLRG